MQTLFKDNFCFDRGFNSDFEFVGTVSLVCELEPEYECAGRACVRSCCLDGHHFEARMGKCVANDDESAQAEEEGEYGIDFPDNAKIFYGFPACAPMHIYDSRNEDMEILLDSGHLLIKVF